MKKPPTRTTWPMLLLGLLFKRHQDLINELAYARAEADYYRSLLPKKRRAFTPEWRRTFAELGHKVGWSRLKEITTVAHMKTIQGWYRNIVLGAKGVANKKIGRPKIPQSLEKLIVRIAKENPGWGQMRIRGELKKLALTAAARTIAAVLKRNGLPTRPKRPDQRRWKPFVMGNLHEMVATDFFTAKNGPHYHGTGSTGCPEPTTAVVATGLATAQPGNGREYLCGPGSASATRSRYPGPL